MIIQTKKEINGVVYAYTYSDSGFMIERDGVCYSEAVDPLDSGRVYTETETLIETPEMTIEEYLNMSVLKVIDKAVSHSTSV